MRHDKDLLKESLSVEDVMKLLQLLGANYIEHFAERGEIHSNTICHNLDGGSHKLYYYEESYNFFCYTDCSCSMDIFKVVMKNYAERGVEISFPDAVNWVAEKSGKSFGFGFNVEMDKETEVSWLDRFTNRKKKEYPELETYSDRLLNVFSYGFYHDNFLKDNISIDAMNKFEIGFYLRDERITLPHRHYENGKLISVRGRATNQYDIDAGRKYIPLTIQGQLYSHPSFLSLYGLWQNRETIQRLKKVIIFESEKSVLQCESFWSGNNFSVALSGRNISQRQIDILLDLGIEEVILATDKMFIGTDTTLHEKDVNFILNMGRKFSPYVRTYTLFDLENLLEYKESPSDRGRNVLMRLMATKKEIVNVEYEES